ncbi:MAG: acyltransferase [Solirubrobacteraceae bacterium]|nr:acyltransferase [Solirubrobacteraceae bacterium]
MSAFSGKRFGFASCGRDVTIYELVRILGADAMHVGDHVIIDDFVFIDGRAGMTIGARVHIAGFVSIIGQGETVLGDFSFISAGSRLVTGTDAFDGSGLVGPSVPDDLRNVTRGRIEIGRHAGLGSNVVVHPDVVIGEGCVVGSGSVVTRSLPPWTVCVGSPARPVKDRPSERILALEADLLGRDE